MESKKLILEKLNIMWWLPEAGEGSKEGRWAEALSDNYTGTRRSDMHLPSMVAVDGTDSVPQKAKKEEKRDKGKA